MIPRLVFVTKHRQIVALLILVALVLTVSTAQADVTLVQKVTQQATGTATRAGESKQMMVTSYYKGRKFRTGSADAVTIVDGDSGKVYNLNLAKKTYTVLSLTSGPAATFTGMFDLKTAVTLKPGGKTRTILGRPSKNYLFVATIKMALKKGFADTMAAQVAGGQSGSNAPAIALPTLVAEGENWVTESVNLPPGASASAFTAMTRQVPGLAPLGQKFASIKGVTLEASLTMRTEGSGQNGPHRAQSRGKMTTILTAIHETPLSDALFQVPAGYTETTPPSGFGAMRNGARPH